MILLIHKNMAEYAIIYIAICHNLYCNYFYFFRLINVKILFFEHFCTYCWFNNYTKYTGLIQFSKKKKKTNLCTRSVNRHKKFTEWVVSGLCIGKLEIIYHILWFISVYSSVYYVLVLLYLSISLVRVWHQLDLKLFWQWFLKCKITQKLKHI